MASAVATAPAAASAKTPSATPPSDVYARRWTIAIAVSIGALLEISRAVGRHLERDELFGAMAACLRDLVPTQRFGAMMFLLLSAALVGNLFLLPAVLASPIAYFFGRRLRRGSQPQKRDHAEATAAAHEPVTRHLRRDSSHDARK